MPNIRCHFAKRGAMNNKQNLKKSIDKLKGLKNSLAEFNIDPFEMDEINIFGFGSLPSQPHYIPPKNSNASLVVSNGLAQGWKRDVCCMSVRSGTPEFPGLTLGLEKNKDATQAGGILTYKNLSQEEKVDMLEAFFKREHVQELPIYSFTMIEAEREDGKKVACITCIADHSSPGYAGHFNHSDRVTMIAAALNLEQNPPRTNYSYFSRFILLPLFSQSQNETLSKNAFQVRYQKALEAEKDSVMLLWKDIENYRKTHLTAEECQRREVIELVQAQNFYTAELKKSPQNIITKFALMYLESLREKTGVITAKSPTLPNIKKSFTLTLPEETKTRSPALGVQP